MTRHIKYILLVLIFQNNILFGENKYSFYKAVGYCNSSIGVYSQHEAEELFTKKIIKLETYKNRGEINSTKYFEDFEMCINQKLNLIIRKTVLYKKEEKFPLQELALINGKYLVFLLNGFSFIFKQQKKEK